jgi:CRP-like cAMP-binding protein
MSTMQAAVYYGSEQNHVLAALPDDEVDLIRPHLQDIDFPPAALVYERGELVDHIYFPQQGIVSLIVPLANGGEIETAMIGPDGVVGSMAVFGVKRALARVMAQVETRALRIATTQLMEILPDAPRLASALMADTEMLMFQIQQMGACNAVHPVEARLARWLLRAADCLDNSSIPLTQELMSQMLGVQRTTVNLMIRVMANAGVLRNRRGRVEITNRGGLEGIACECYACMRTNRRMRATPLVAATAEALSHL